MRENRVNAYDVQSVRVMCHYCKIVVEYPIDRDTTIHIACVGCGKTFQQKAYNRASAILSVLKSIQFESVKASCDEALCGVFLVFKNDDIE
jgi:ribosomal protein L37AE/L43A